MEKYVAGAIREAIGKGLALMRKIPGAQLGLSFGPLAATANKEIEQIIFELNFLSKDADYNDPRNIREKFSRFKHWSQELSKIENIVIAAITHKTDDDEFVNRLVQQICREINYPLLPPVTSCLSQGYYHIYTDYNLLCLPLLESEFVLHLSDIYHELGHPLLSMHPKVEPFRRSLGYFQVEIRRYYDTEIQRRAINKANTNPSDPIQAMKETWVEKWAEELFCDLFATYTLGPAYLWSNLHMCAKMSWDPYRIPPFHRTDHPPNEARMRAALLGLQQIGLTAQIPAIQEKWNAFKEIVGKEKPQGYSLAVPDDLLKLGVEHCLVGVKEIGCEIAKEGTTDKVNRLLNDSWKVFWENPEKFFEWEKDTLKDFKFSLKNT